MMFLTQLAQAHSFVTCTNYDSAKNQCCGFPKNYDKGYIVTSKSGYGFLNQGNAMECNADQKSAPADPKYPVAQVTPGGALVLTWPPQNHAGGQGSDGSSPRVAEAYVYDITGGAKTLLATLNFRNCVKGGTQTTTLCSGSIKAPAKAGAYNLMWAWEQNTGYYTTCFDLTVTDTPVNGVCSALDATPAPALAATGSTSQAPASGSPSESLTDVTASPLVSQPVSPGPAATPSIIPDTTTTTAGGKKCSKKY